MINLTTPADRRSPTGSTSPRSFIDLHVLSYRLASQQQAAPPRPTAVAPPPPYPATARKGCAPYPAGHGRWPLDVSTSRVILEMCMVSWPFERTRDHMLARFIEMLSTCWFTYLGYLDSRLCFPCIPCSKYWVLISYAKYVMLITC